MMGKWSIAVLLWTASVAAHGQELANRSLQGRYFFRHLLLQSSTGMRTAYGVITFDGVGGYAYTGSQIVGSAAPTAFAGNGVYTVKSTGLLALSNPQRPGASIQAGLGQGAVVGASTGDAGVYDLFVAIAAPASVQTNAAFNGTWDISALEFPGGSTAQRRNAAFRMIATGAGSGGTVSVSGKSAASLDRLENSTVGNVAYTIAADGSGTLTLPGSGLLNGVRSLWLSADGSLALFGSSAPGVHDFWVGTKSAAAPAAFRNLFFRAGLRIDSGKPGSYSGSSSAAIPGRLVSSLRVRQPEGVLGLSSANPYSLAADGTGTIDQGRLALGLESGAFQTNGLADSTNYELSLAVRAAAPSGAGVFVNPQGVVNAASFAPVGAPLSPGGFFTIFGSGLAPSTAVAPGLPFPAALGGVQVLLNNTPVPLYFVSPTQISALAPFAVEGTSVTVAVLNNGQRSNSVELPLSRTAPGIFTVNQAGTGHGALLHANYSAVGPASPARRGETVLLYLTGLGPVAPEAADGAAAPSNPLRTVQSDVKVYVGGRQAAVTFKGLAPGFAGLYQVNFTVPANAPTGSAVALAIETPEAFHDMADIAVSN